VALEPQKRECGEGDWGAWDDGLQQEVEEEVEEGWSDEGGWQGR
jgi:hypothetical protein